MSKSKINATKVIAAIAKKATAKPVTASTVVAQSVQLAPKAKREPRITRNGVARPYTGGKCAAIWDKCDEMVALGTTPTVAALRDFAAAKGYNVNNAQIEMYGWRKHNGITGRIAAATAVQATA